MAQESFVASVKLGQQGGCELNPVPHLTVKLAVLGAAVAGFFSGVLAITWILCAVRLAWTVRDGLILFGAISAVGFFLAVVPSVLLRRFISPFWMGVLTLVFIYGGEWWFRAAAPHTVAPSWKGGLLGWLLVTVVLVVLGWAVRLSWVRQITLVLIGFAWIALLISIPSIERGNGSGPNVLLVSIDTMRADHVGAWAGIEKGTPELDQLAQDGARFSATYAPIAVTGPSHAAMLTGAGPWRTEMLLNGVSLSAEFPMVSERLLAAGYRTGAFVSAYVLEGELGFQRGFEVYDDDFEQLRGWAHTGPGRIHAMLRRHFSPQHIVERRGDATVDRALRWLTQSSEVPFFAWVHLFDPHGPYSPPDPFDRLHYTGDPRSEQHTSMEQVSGVADYLKPSLDGIRDVDWVRAQYAGEVSFVDQQIGRLVKTISDHDLAENTLIVVVGDHGESLGENDVWFNHGGDLDGSAMRVPLIAYWPTVIEAGQVFDRPVGVIDVGPTIMGMVSLPSPTLDGVDLSPALRGSPIERGPVRSLCYDRVINQQGRAEGTIDKPTHMLARSWGSTGWFQIGTHPSRGAIQFGTGDQAELQSLATLLGSLGTGVHQRAALRTDDAIHRLKSLGYVE
jgi:arylsulfatase A-like enzyme